jgi:hypothetical protein
MNARVRFTILLLIAAKPLLAQDTVVCSEDTTGLYHRYVHIEQLNELPEAITRDTFCCSEQQSACFFVVEPDYRSDSVFSTAIYVTDKLRTSVLRIMLTDHAQYSPAVSWRNEQTLHIRLWLGRITALSMLFDCNSGYIVYSSLERYNTE